MIRNEAVADSFYPGDQKELKRIIAKMLASAEVDEKRVKDAVAFVAPHAGYIYSGPVAAYSYNALAVAAKQSKADTFIVVGPNHTGMGYPISISPDDWMTPFGVVKNDIALSELIANASPMMKLDSIAHMNEHSVEVQLPFLQSVVESPRCVFICMGDQSTSAALQLADAIHASVEALKRRAIVIASSDFNHYDPAEIAEARDMPAIKALEEMDYIKFNRLLMESGDTACGYGPITTAAIFAQRRGAKRAMLLKYSNSGEATNDYSSVVAYASIAFV